MDISFLLLPAAASAALGAALFAPERAGRSRATRPERDRAAPLQPDFRLLAAALEHDGAAESESSEHGRASHATEPPCATAPSWPKTLARVTTAMRSYSRHPTGARLVPEFAIDEARAVEAPGADASSAPVAGRAIAAPATASIVDDEAPAIAGESLDGLVHPHGPLGGLAVSQLVELGSRRIDELSARVRRWFARPSGTETPSIGEVAQPITPIARNAGSDDAEPLARVGSDGDVPPSPSWSDRSGSAPVDESPSVDGGRSRASSIGIDRAPDAQGDDDAHRFATLVTSAARATSASALQEAIEPPVLLDASSAPAAGLGAVAAADGGGICDIAAPLREPTPAPSASHGARDSHVDAASAVELPPHAEPVLVRAPHRSPERAIPLTRLPLRHETHDVTWPQRLEPPKRGLSTQERHRLLDEAVAEKLDLGVLLDAYREEDAEGRVRVVRALGTSNTAQARSVLIEALRRGGDAERAEAIDSLLAIGAADALAPALSDRVEAIAAKALLGIGTSAGASPTRAVYKSLTSAHIEPARADALLALLGGFLE